MSSRAHWLVAAAGAWLAALAPSLSVEAAACPSGMARVRDFCVDQYEASLVEVTGGKTLPHPHFQPVGGARVRAVSKRGVFPQGYISRDEAEAACKEAKKRLCTDDEWLTACRGRKPTKFPYGDEHKDGYCNDSGVSPLNKLFPDRPDGEKYGASTMNDPRLNQVPGGLGKTGGFGRCRNGFKLHDMVGNLHEWTADKGGTFRGGYYLDTKINGEGCDYKTTAHDAKYHDYSTGFRCCK
ncbi:MAG: SUMF1/EgtB/PvdO family nonheme iron enzyme [Polyangiaceae bacterium]|nr:SUMF1/EgtB/PvdO family nonheme iron enzyme [Polyangiaceae bacterium]